MDSTAIISLAAVCISLASLFAHRLTRRKHDPIDHFIGGDWPHVPTDFKGRHSGSITHE
jgi:hypothetical protein